MGPSKGIRISVRYSVWTPLPLPPLFLTRPEWNRADSASFLAPFSTNPNTDLLAGDCSGGGASQRVVEGAQAYRRRRHKLTGGSCCTGEPAAAAVQGNQQRQRKQIGSGGAGESSARMLRGSQIKVAAASSSSLATTSRMQHQFGLLDCPYCFIPLIRIKSKRTGCSSNGLCRNL